MFICVTFLSGPDRENLKWGAHIFLIFLQRFGIYLEHQKRFAGPICLSHALNMLNMEGKKLNIALSTLNATLVVMEAGSSAVLWKKFITFYSFIIF